jgi:hypothetical protein
MSTWACCRPLFQLACCLTACCRLNFVCIACRTLPLFEEAWAAQGARLMPQPDAVITGVGTRIHLNTAQGVDA